MKINYFFRKHRKGFNSIEELFNGILSAFSQSIEVENTMLPHDGASPINILKNLVFARRNKGKINHVTGDVHYLTIVLGKKSILTIHDIKSALAGGLLKRCYIYILWFYLPVKRVKIITTISEFSRQELINLLPFASEKTRVVHNPYRPELLKHVRDITPLIKRDEQCKVMLVGTKENKNLNRTIRAVKNLNVELHILGKLKTDQIDLLEKYQVPYINNYHLTYNKVIDWYKACDILCFASTYEGFGMPIIEAQVLGVPVVTSNLGAMKEVAGSGACLVDPYREHEIEQGIQRIISDRNYMEELVKKGRENVKRFDPNKIRDRYFEIYNELHS